ncbi:ESCRT-II complex subunit-domain-containing protein [Chytridium lagenaria]|nr:ESCRT-II complex subunit-domain-containing protein [Chytridium lagenaria]
MAATTAHTRIQNFPPFYSRQPNQETWRKQKQLWCEVILTHCSTTKTCVLTVKSSNEIAQPDVFGNDKINRRLPQDAREEIVNDLVNEGYAEWENKQTKARCFVWWRHPDDWASLVYEWALSTGQRNSVCTMYEIVHGDTTEGEDFHGLDEDFMMKVLKNLEKQKKAQLFLELAPRIWESSFIDERQHWMCFRDRFCYFTCFFIYLISVLKYT